MPLEINNASLAFRMLSLFDFISSRRKEFYIVDGMSRKTEMIGNSGGLINVMSLDGFLDCASVFSWLSIGLPCGRSWVQTPTDRTNTQGLYITDDGVSGVLVWSLCY